MLTFFSEGPDDIIKLNDIQNELLVREIIEKTVKGSKKEKRYMLDFIQYKCDGTNPPKETKELKEFMNQFLEKD